MDKQIISIQLPKNLLTSIKEDADKNYTTISAIIRKILLEYYRKSIK